MSHSKRSAFAACAAAACCLLATQSARAEALPGNAPTSGRLDVALVGTINSTCRIGGSGDIDFGELTGNERATAPLMLDCNVPFEIGLEARHGGLSHSTQPQGEGPFSGRLTYHVTITVPTISPEPGSIHGEFTSQELVGKRTLTSNGAISAGTGLIEFRTDVPQGAGLLAGAYSDILCVTVTPRV